MNLVRHLDLVVLALALPVFLARGLPDARLGRGQPWRGSRSARSRRYTNGPRGRPGATRARTVGIVTGR